MHNYMDVFVSAKQELEPRSNFKGMHRDVLSGFCSRQILGTFLKMHNYMDVVVNTKQEPEPNHHLK